MKKLIIFDMGNTLIDFHSGEHTDDEKDIIGLANMSRYLKQSHGIECSIESLKNDFLDKWYGDFYMREQLVELDVSKYVEDYLSINGFDEIKVDSFKLMREFYDQYINEVIANEGAYDALMELSNNYHIGVISNCILYDDYYVESFEKLGLGNFIDKFIFSYSRQIRKPDKRLFLEMLSHFDIEPKDAYMVGDSPDADMMPAIELGMKTVQYHKANKKVVGHDLFNKFNELPKLILEIEKRD